MKYEVILYADELSGSAPSGSAANAYSTFPPVNAAQLTKDNGYLVCELRCNNPTYLGTNGQIEVTSSGTWDVDEWTYVGDWLNMGIDTGYKTFTIPLSSFSGELDVNNINFIRWYNVANGGTLEIYIRNVRVVYFPENLPVWHESTTKSWTKVPELLPFETRMFYAKKTEGFAPNGKAIFNKLFDEFSGSSVDTDIWTVLNSTGISVANGVLTATNSSGWLESKESFGNEDIILESRFEHISMPANGYNPLSLWKSATDTFGGLIHPDSSNIRTYYMNNGNWITIAGGISGIADITCRIIIHTNGTCDIQYINNDTGTVFSEALGVTNTISNEPIRFIRREDDASLYYNQSFEVQFHHILARKYVATEPTVTVKDCGSFCQITVTNNTPDTMSDVQVSFDSTPLNLTSTDDSLLILPMNNSERSNVPYMDLFDGCVAYYDFMGDAQDIMGNHDGVVTGASLTTDHMGIQNAAYSFDGVDDYIGIGKPLSTLDQDFTMVLVSNASALGGEKIPFGILLDTGGDCSIQYYNDKPLF
jgi:hypothetical protein